MQEGDKVAERNLRKTRIGKVVSNKMDNSCHRGPCKAPALWKNCKTDGKIQGT